jgi:outer membrane protein assembly factor BamA
MPLPALGLSKWQGYSAAFFADVGNVWLLGTRGALATSQRPAYAASLPALRYGLGTGLRIATPIGPLQLDVAFNPVAWTATGPQRALLVEEWEEPSVRAHLSLGALW